MSPLQIRSCRKPDGVCLVVGSCSRGFDENISSDIIFSCSSSKKIQDTQLQYFWEVSQIVHYDILIRKKIVVGNPIFSQ